VYKKVFLAVLFLLIFSLLWFYLQWRKEDLVPSTEKIEVINLGNDVKPLFLWAKVWGVSGNHEQIVLSEKNKTKADKEFDYIFYTSEIYFKQDADGKVTLYAPKSSISEPLKGIPDVKIVELSTNGELKDYELNFSKYGLEKISVYK
jgi:hypothetical protein